MGKNKKLFMRLTYILFIIFLFASCKVTKYVDREKIIVDSSVVHQYNLLQKEYQQTIERYEKERETWEKTGVVFDTDCDTVTNTVTKIIYDNGKLKSIEGRVKTLNIDLTERTEELYDAHRTIDELSTENERLQVELNKKQTTVIKEVQRKVTPWWIWLLFLGGLVTEWRIGLLRRIWLFVRR
jgi:hypothetical protein